MKIISQPIVVWTKNIECSNCKASLEADLDDLRRGVKTMYDQRDGSYEGTFFYVRCPVKDCRNVIDVDIKNLTQYALGKAKVEP